MIRCLLIDDDLDDQEIFKMCLSKINNSIEFVSSYDGADAVELLKDGSYIPDYIFLDVNMPKMDGFVCLEKLRKINYLKDTKIFMYSTTSQHSSFEKSKALGADDFVIKPYKTTELKETLSKIFRPVPR